MKVLFFATNSFPFGKGEPLVSNQIDYLAKEFDKIIIVSSDTKNAISYTLPENVQAYKLSFGLSAIAKFLGILNVFSKNVIKEKAFISQNLDKKFTLQILKVLLNYYTVSLKYKSFYKAIIKSQNLKNEQLYFHSYWCTEAAVGFCLLKNEYPEAKMDSRFHAYDLYLERHNPAYLPLRGFLFEKLDKLFFISDQGKKYFQDTYLKGVINDRLIVNRLGVSKDDKYFLENNKNKFSGFRIVSCSSIIELKRIHLIIEALSLIETIEVEWIHFGNGPLQQEMESLAQDKLGKKKNIHFRFHGFIDNSELKEYYYTHQVDLFINVSRYEGVPISIMEALAFNIPCVATNVGGVHEIIDETVGFLLPVDFSSEELVKTIERFLSKPLEEINQFKQNAFLKWYNNYNGQTNYESLIKEIREEYKVCSRCLYDNKIFPKIKFNIEGVCSICEIYDNLQEKTVFKDSIGQQKLELLISDIKKSGNNKTYDCIVGVSGGVDSSYVAYLVTKWKLKPLIIHVDNGWNSELAVQNIEQILKTLNLDLHTHVINWEEMKDLQRSFVKANVLDIDLPFDNAFMSVLYSTAKKHGVKYILSGHNTVTEGWMPDNFTHYKLDTLNIRDIHKKFGEVKLNSFPLMGPIKSWYYKKVKGIQLAYPLDYIEYNKDDVKRLLIDQLGWRDYGGKHYENVYTKFYQGYILLNKFGIDKRVSHLSTLICSGQLSREDAKAELIKPAYNSSDFESDKTFFLKKLEFTEEFFNEYMSSPEIKHTQYKSYINVLDFLRNVKRKLIKK